MILFRALERLRCKSRMQSGKILITQYLINAEVFDQEERHESFISNRRE
jgi:hypothetical protein